MSAFVIDKAINGPRLMWVMCGIYVRFLRLADDILQKCLIFWHFLHKNNAVF